MFIVNLLIFSHFHRKIYLNYNSHTIHVQVTIHDKSRASQAQQSIIRKFQDASQNKSGIIEWILT